MKRMTIVLVAVVLAASASAQGYPRGTDSGERGGWYGAAGERSMDWNIYAGMLLPSVDPARIGRIGVATSYQIRLGLHRSRTEVLYVGAYAQGGAWHRSDVSIRENGVQIPIGQTYGSTELQRFLPPRSFTALSGPSTSNRIHLPYRNVPFDPWIDVQASLGATVTYSLDLAMRSTPTLAAIDRQSCLASVDLGVPSLGRTSKGQVQVEDPGGFWFQRTLIADRLVADATANRMTGRAISRRHASDGWALRLLGSYEWFWYTFRGSLTLASRDQIQYDRTLISN